MDTTAALAAQSTPASVTLTWFERANLAEGQRTTLTWDDLIAWCQAPPMRASKGELPLMKLATFIGDYRSNKSLEAIYGIEGDYDGGTVQPSYAAGLLASAGIRALVMTTPSHRPDAPRWRVWCPTSGPLPPAERHGLAALANGGLGGILAPESFVASQAFYVGSVHGGEPVQCFPIGGKPIDLVSGITPIGPPQSAGTRHPLGTLPTVDVRHVEAALSRSIPTNAIGTAGAISLPHIVARVADAQHGTHGALISRPMITRKTKSCGDRSKAARH